MSSINGVFSSENDLAHYICLLPKSGVLESLLWNELMTCETGQMAIDLFSLKCTC